MTKTDMQKLNLREIQYAELDILRAFRSFCLANGLRYSLCGGTLLGAVRHKGFIPWDDDIDVFMPRPDYEKFIELIKSKKVALPGYLALADNGIPFVKIIDKRYSLASEAGDSVENLWIDILPVDGYPADDRAAEKYWKKLLFYRRVVLYNYLSLVHKRGAKKFLLRFFKVYAKLYGAERAVKNANALVAKYPYGKSDFIGCAVWGCYGIGERIPADSFDNLTEIGFEGENFSAISGWHEYLTGIYGDYMRLPPEDKRECHGFEVYKINDGENL